MTRTTVSVPAGTDAATLQSMIDAAEGPTLFALAPGRYRIDQTVVLDRPGLYLQGAGRGETVLEVAEGVSPAVQLGHALFQPEIIDTAPLGQYAGAGSTRITLGGELDVVPGDHLYLEQANTGAFLDSIKDTQWRQDSALRTHLAEVTSVTGDVVTLGAPLPFDFLPADTEVQERTLLPGLGLSDLTLIGPLGEPDPAEFSNVASGTGHMLVMLGGVTGAEVHGLGMENATSHGLVLEDSRAVDVRDLYAEGAHDKGPGGNGYALWIRDVHDSSFTDLTLLDARHAVLFASYTSANGNLVEVTHTNRDVNFHGGRDQFNTVVVDEMIRTPAEQRFMSTAVFYNDGESYGAPTDPATNPVLFRTLVATTKGEAVTAHPDGAELWTLSGADSITTGPGDDLVMAGTGTDVIFASGGRDSIDGGSSNDEVIFAGASTNFTMAREGDILALGRGRDVTLLRDVESVVFSDARFDADDLLDIAPEATTPLLWPEAEPPVDLGPRVTGAVTARLRPPEPIDPPQEDAQDDSAEDEAALQPAPAAPPAPATAPQAVADPAPETPAPETDSPTSAETAEAPADLVGPDGLPIIGGGAGWDRYAASQSFRMGDDLEAMEFTPDDADLAVLGNALDNNMRGNDGANLLDGGPGDDAIFARGGPDTLRGGPGDDRLHGASDADVLDGGPGDDDIRAGNGDDIIQESSGNDTIDGQGGDDELVLTHPRAAYRVEQTAEGFVLTGPEGRSVVTGVERFSFADGTLSGAELAALAVQQDAGLADPLSDPFGLLEGADALTFATLSGGTLATAGLNGSGPGWDAQPISWQLPGDSFGLDGPLGWQQATPDPWDFL